MLGTIDAFKELEVNDIYNQWVGYLDLERGSMVLWVFVLSFAIGPTKTAIWRKSGKPLVGQYLGASPDFPRNT